MSVAADSISELSRDEQIEKFISIMKSECLQLWAQKGLKFEMPAGFVESAEAARREPECIAVSSKLKKNREGATTFKFEIRDDERVTTVPQDVIDNIEEYWDTRTPMMMNAAMIVAIQQGWLKRSGFRADASISRTWANENSGTEVLTHPFTLRYVVCAYTNGLVSGYKDLTEGETLAILKKYWST